MKFKFLLATALVGLSLSTAAQKKVMTAEEEKEAHRILNEATPAEHNAMIKALYSKKPTIQSKKSTANFDAVAIPNLPMETMTGNYTNVRFPGEFEELQGMFISWPLSWTGVIDTSNSGMGRVYRQMVAGLVAEPNFTVYINIDNGPDSVKIKNYLTNNGIDTTNCRFLVHTTDAFWARDYGPVNFYYGAQDSIGWLDLKYYPGRDLDNLKPTQWGEDLNIPVVHSSIFFEGGNVLLDGCGSLFTSEMVNTANAYEQGWNENRTRDSLMSEFSLTKLHRLNILPNDGGTGHIDLALDMTDENTFVYTKFPPAMDTVPGFTDYDSALANLSYLDTINSFNNKPYYFYHIPLPTRDDGSWYTSASQYNSQYTRTYTNHVFANKTILQPIFSNATSGYKLGDSLAIEAIKKAYPGYRIVPIDMRILDGSGGSIHCITKEFHATNPIHITHYPYRDYQEYQSSYPIDAVIKNNSGISSAKLIWRKKGASTWTTINMTAAADNHWLANIPTSSTVTDSIEYYIQATSNNGKTINKPLVSPEGAYRFYYGAAPTTINPHLSVNAGIGNLYPNPTKDNINLELNIKQPMDINYHIIDIAGKVISHKSLGTLAGNNMISIETSTLQSGIYFIKLDSNGADLGVRKFVKK